MRKKTGSKILLEYLKNDFYRESIDNDYMVIPLDLDELDLKNEWLSQNKPFFFQSKTDGGFTDYLVIDSDNPLIYIYNRLESCSDIKTQMYYLYLMKSAHKYFYLGKYQKSFKHLLDYSFLNTMFSVESESDKNFILSYRNFLIDNVYDSDERLKYFPNLNKNKSDFFNDKVTYYVDHDFLHTKVQIGSRPAYMECLVGEVKFSNQLFKKQTKITKINMILEEAMVLALERCLLPFMLGDEVQLPAYGPTEAFKYGLVRVATNISSGPFRMFAADNFKNIFEEFENKHKDYYKIISSLDLTKH